MAREIIGRSEFARRCGVTPGAVTQALDGALSAAKFDKRVDAGHPAAIAYAAKHAADPTKKGPPPPPPPEPPQAPEDMILNMPDDIRALLDWPLRDLIEKFGTAASLVEYLKATQVIEVVNERRLKNAKTEGTLVSRDLVARGIIEPIEAAHLKLLNDGSKTMARRAVALIEAGRSVEDVEKLMVDQIGSFIKPVKAKTKRAMDAMIVAGA